MTSIFNCLIQIGQVGADQRFLLLVQLVEEVNCMHDMVVEHCNQAAIVQRMRMQ